MKSRTRRATSMKCFQSLHRQPVINLTVGLAVTAALLVGTCTASAAEDVEPSTATDQLFLSDSQYESGFILPLDDPRLGVDQPTFEPAVRLTGLSGDTESAEPIPVPLPPGVATGMIGLAAVAIARYRFKLRRA